MLFWVSYFFFRSQELGERPPDEYVSPFNSANMAVALGEIDEAFEWLARAYEERTPLLVSLGISPMYDSLRGDPRYETLLKQIGVKAISTTA